MSGSRRSENPSTYFVQDRKNEKELTRLAIQDRLVTAVMGGVLPEQDDPTVFGHVLDVGCGTGGWVIEAAQTYPAMSLVGIDISQHMIRYACTQAEAYHVHDRIEFHVMDALRTLEFPAAVFDLVNLRFGVSFVRTWDWPKMLSELLRVTRPGGVVRAIESDIIFQSNSPSLTQLCEMTQCAFFRAGLLFEQESTGLTSHLAGLLNWCGCQQIQTKAYPIEYRGGTPEGEAFCENLKLAFQTLRPFIQKWGYAVRDYAAIYRQAFDEIRQPDSLIIVNMLTAWGCKP
ncbi:MAG TPA: class I SAM-dependent methyltransferase [Ktedonobacteraceae bacterium]|nr:class I SAM-dependent methyltransferase [Ktedonobacteraceae bacterium]